VFRIPSRLSFSFASFVASAPARTALACGVRTWTAQTSLRPSLPLVRFAARADIAFVLIASMIHQSAPLHRTPSKNSTHDLVLSLAMPERLQSPKRNKVWQQALAYCRFGVFYKLLNVSIVVSTMILSHAVQCGSDFPIHCHNSIAIGIK
jgi:hypothetical protein